MISWTSEGYKIISKFFVGYGAGFSAVMGVTASIDPTQITLFNMLIYPSISGFVTIFPQLAKTFGEASKR